VPEVPLLLVANEFFDALAIRQHVDGIERRVAIVGDGLAFDRDGSIVESSPERDAVAATIAKRLAEHGGVALIIDYGHQRTSAGETLQAVRGHAFAPVLADPGEQDLTAHVDFEALARAASDVGAAVTKVVTQGAWLRSLGIAERADSLARANPDRADDIRSALERLTAPDRMGELFKVMALHAPQWPAPAGFA
jgi:SAM-dependent MidA family methyltransferase